MSETQIGNEIDNYLPTADGQYLPDVQPISKNNIEDETVGFLLDGTPLTKTDHFILVEKSRKEGLEGKARSIDDALAEIKNW